MPSSEKQIDTRPDVSRLVAALICGATVVACLAYAYFRDQLPTWWRGYGGGIPYVFFWVAFWFVIFPFRRCILPICIFATFFTCLLEFLQLWKPEWLVRIRSTRLGAALLGSGFDWNDFLPYFIGGAIGYLVLMVADRSCRNRKSPDGNG